MSTYFTRLISLLLLMILTPVEGALLGGAISQGVMSLDKDQTLTLLNNFQNHYLGDNRYQTFTALDLFVGHRWHLPQQASLMLGIEAGLTSQSRAKGEVNQFANNDANNLAYRYHLRHQHLALLTKYQRQFSAHVIPYIEGFIGGARNNASDYQETPLNFPAVNTPPFADNTSTSLTYGAGIGLTLKSYKQLETALGYRVMNLGQVALGTNTAQTTKEHIRQSLVLAHLLRFSVIFVP